MTTPQYDKALLHSCGEDTFIDAFVQIRRPHRVSVGKHTAIDWGFYLTTVAEIGDYIHIAPYVTIIGGEEGAVRLEHFTTIAAGSRLISVSDEHLGEGLVGPTIPPPYQDSHKKGPIIFERFASIATNVVVLPGVTLAEGSVIGACSLVTKNTEPWTIYAGVPARPRRDRPREKMIAHARSLGYPY